MSHVGFYILYVLGSTVVLVAFVTPVAMAGWWFFGIVRRAYVRADAEDQRQRERRLS